MIDTIKKILKEEVGKNPYKFVEGGYIVPAIMKDATIFLTDEEYKKIEPLNNNMKELYESKKEYLKNLALHNKGVIQHVINKMGSK